MARRPRVVVIGAGIGGLSAAVDLAAQGYEPLVLERAAAPGGKMREIDVGGALVDAGPTVLTMPFVFEQLFAAVGADFGAHVRLRRAERLARHAWSQGPALDLFSDVERSADAIGDFAGKAEAENYRAFARRAESIYLILRDTFIRASRPSLPALVGRVGRLKDLLQISSFTTLSAALESHFRDPRLRQLFGRYATYCGSSPYLAPATLMLVAHVEREGVWLIEGGMRRLADAMKTLAEAAGARFRFNCAAARLIVEQGRVVGVETTAGERLPADAVIFNGDVGALAEGRLGEAAQGVAPAVAAEQSSLSALTFALRAKTRGFGLIRHNVFFGDDYRQEFDSIFNARRLPLQPTVYVCAQDRDADLGAAKGPERLFLLVNAPAQSANTPLSEKELQTCEAAMYQQLQRCGLTLEPSSAQRVRTTPADFAAMFPGSRGALYGPASHGWRASFTRGAARTKLRGLYLAGGSVHPGPGVPMAALSGRQAAMSLTADFASMRRSNAAATPGGISTRSATTAPSG